MEVILDRSVLQRLVTDHGLVVSKETVQHALKIIDPDGVDGRLRYRPEKKIWPSSLILMPLLYLM